MSEIDPTYKYKLLIVDDEPANLRMLNRLFRNDYDVVTASSGPNALELLNKHDIAVIISDQRMPEMKGIDFLKRAASIRPHTVRIVLTGYTDVSDLVEAINSGVIYKYITKPWVNTDLVLNVRRATEYYETLKKQHLLTRANERLELRLLSTFQGLIRVAREAVRVKRPELAEHCRRTANYAALIGERYSLAPKDLEALIFAALLHEFPHLDQPIEVDLNLRVLSEDHLNDIRSRFEFGLRPMTRIPDMQDIVTIIRYQHECYDGSGFFSHLDGEKIPLGSRILAVANFYDEIHSGRRPELLCTDEEIIEWMRERAGKDLDPEVVDVCLKIELLRPREAPVYKKAMNFEQFAGAGL
ncbi:MAG: response regulator [Pyrinomonadaceae bacterium]